MPSGAADGARWCSRRCRSLKLTALDRRLEAALAAGLDRLSSGSTLCPSQIAREIGGDDWRPLMEPTRQAARRLVAQGRAEITQGGHRVDPSTAKGPIRVRPSR